MVRGEGGAVTDVGDCEIHGGSDEDSGREGGLDRRSQPNGVKRLAKTVTSGAVLEHFRNVVGVVGICLLMASLGVAFVHVTDVLDPQCIVNAQGSCAALPDFRVLGLTGAGFGLLFVVVAVIMSKLLPQRL
jgi:hypothetical protein